MTLLTEAVYCAAVNEGRKLLDAEDADYTSEYIRGMEDLIIALCGLGGDETTRTQVVADLAGHGRLIPDGRPLLVRRRTS
jgi:hypothetical protein